MQARPKIPCTPDVMSIPSTYLRKSAMLTAMFVKWIFSIGAKIIFIEAVPAMSMAIPDAAKMKAPIIGMMEVALLTGDEGCCSSSVQADGASRESAVPGA